MWGHLKQLRESLHGPWLLLGDFNEVLLPSEVREGSFFRSRAAKFAEVMEHCNLLDLGATGSAFT